MEPDRWRRIEAALDSLLDLEEKVDLEAAVRDVCTTDPEIQEDVLRLAREARSSGGPLSSSLSEEASDLLGELQAFLDGPATTGDGGRIVGSYRLLELIGRGGMGVVYVAERSDHQFEKRVAVKLLPRGLETPDMERRFRIERQILADLEHPSIARLLDGGVTNESYPYLVMELVDGRPIDAFCSENAVGLRDRLALFKRVCEAVQFAHQNLVVHRDLKPSNILVTGDGRPKLLDFGVAKLMEGDHGGRTRGRTLIQPRTPGYASPEQLANRAVTTATDVYSLGVVLFQLLAGRTPHRLERLSPTVSETAVYGQPTELASVAAAAVADEPHAQEMLPASWSHQLRGDLDTIVSKALARDPDRRYSTAEQLADDVDRYLEDQPIEARRPTRAYRTRKFIARHKLAAASATLVFLSIVGTFLGVAWQAEKARIEAERATSVANLLSDLFADADPYSGEAREMSVRDLLERGERRVRAELDDEPALRTDLLEVIGQAYAGQGIYARAVELHREVLAERRSSSGDSALRVSESMTHLASSLRLNGAYDEAEPLYREALATTRRETGIESAATAALVLELGKLESARGEAAAALEHYEECLRIRRELAGGPDYEVAVALNYLSGALDALGEDRRGLELLREAYDLAQQTVGEEHPSTVSMRHNLAFRLHEAGDFTTAERLYRQALELSERTLGTEHPATGDHLMMLGRVLVDRGDFAGAEQFVERAASIYGELEPTHFNRIASELNLATVYRELGRLEDAEALYRQGVVRLEALIGPGHVATARARSLLGLTLHAQVDLDRAERELRSALAIQRDSTATPNHLAETLVGLGSLLSDQGRSAEALPLLQEALEIRERIQPEGNWQIAEARLELGAVLLAEGGDGAEELLRSGYDGLRSSLPDGGRRLRRGKRFVSALRVGATGD